MYGTVSGVAVSGVVSVGGVVVVAVVVVAAAASAGVYRVESGG